MRACEPDRRRNEGGARRSDGGFVAVETAVALPALVMFAMALVWALLVAAAQIQCVDAARIGARAAARQDPDGAVVELARAAAPRGAEVTVAREGDRVRVVVVARPPVLGRLAFDLREEAVAVVEGTVGDGVTGVPEGMKGGGVVGPVEGMTGDGVTGLVEGMTRDGVTGFVEAVP
ncbi:TadE family type IV pilus minor pilin [Streptomyces sp. NPDC048290]|uniref:TadE family type IV pilus minor pilin n=1 Tax=Streptomyces sp. NPDC048290 TaxID=3155811 RepID=UPI00344A0E86